MLHGGAGNYNFEIQISALLKRQRDSALPVPPHFLADIKDNGYDGYHDKKGNETSGWK